MPGFFRKVFKRLAVTVNIIIVAVFLLACLSPFINTFEWWFFGFLSLAFPYLLLVVILFVVLWIVSRSKWRWLGIVAILLSFKSIFSVFGVHIFSRFNITRKEAGSIRVMTWNVRKFAVPFTETFPRNMQPHQQKLMDLIGEYDPDVLCMQEFVSGTGRRTMNNLDLFKKRFGFPYHYFPGDYTTGWESSGTVLFSKYPIIETVRFQMPEEIGRDLESLIGVHLAVEKDTIAVFTGHLQSFGFFRKDYSDLSRIRNQEDSDFSASRNIFRKMRYAFSQRGMQADYVSRQLDDNLIPLIFCGDLNDVPNSYVYYKVKGNRKDVFLQKGAGLGKTYYSFSSSLMRKFPSLRIDYIFCDPRFNVLQTDRRKAVISDHFPVVTDLILQKK